MFLTQYSYFPMAIFITFDKIVAFMKHVYSILFFLLLVNLGCGQTNAKHITEFLEENPQEVVLVDVRTPQEYNAGHLENAENINLHDANFTTKFSTIDKNQTIYVYCKVGGRSAKAQEKLISLGYTNVINLEGGYDAVLAIKK